MGTEHVFYFAEAHIINVKDINTYTLWLLDHGNDSKVDGLKHGVSIPSNELLLEVRRDYTLEKAQPADPVNFIEKATFVDRSDETMKEVTLTALGSTIPLDPLNRNRVAISKELWDKLPPDSWPAPKHHRDRAYQLRLVIVDDPAAGRKYYMGFHAMILDVNASRHESHVLFFSWQGSVRGNAWIKHNSWVDGNVLPVGPHSTLSTASPAGTSGALFVSMDAWQLLELGFLDIPKVPWGAQE